MIDVYEAKRKKKDEAIEQMIKESQIYKFTFNSENGKKSLELLKDRFFCKHTTIGYDDVGRVDRDLMLINEGQRSVILYIMDMIDRDFDILREGSSERVDSVTGV